jgi:ribosomal protein L11 methyltransferase
MSWIELSLNTKHEAVDWVCTLLAETNDIPTDVHITEYTKQDTTATQDIANSNWSFTIYLYIPKELASRASLEKVANLLSPLHRTGLATEMEMAVVEEKPKDSGVLNPLIRRIGKRFVVLTPDTPYESAAEEVTIRLKTSLSFGSGLHPATIISLKLLERHILPTMNVLDLGSGSGILSVAMAKLGANVLAVDNDSMAVQATQENVLCNQVEQQVKVIEGSLGYGSSLGHWMSGNSTDNVETIEAKDTFDLIVANILARVHIALADDLQRALRQTDTHQGLLITAGFTTELEENVHIALTEAGFKLIDSERLDEWVALAYRAVKLNKL